VKNIFVISLTILLGIAGCTGCKRDISSSESIECQRLKVLWERAGEENPQIIIPEIETEFGHESVDEMTWQELGEMVFSTVGCCFCKPHPLAKEWKEYNRLQCIWKHLENENVQRIAFYGQVLEEDTERPEDWCNLWAEINEPEKIKKVVKVLHRAVEREKNKFANEDIVISVVDRMQIITDKHKFIIPISCYREAVRGIGWTSEELRKKLREWGFPDPK